MLSSSNTEVRSSRDALPGSSGACAELLERPRRLSPLRDKGGKTAAGAHRLLSGGRPSCSRSEEEAKQAKASAERRSKSTKWSGEGTRVGSTDARQKIPYRRPILIFARSKQSLDLFLSRSSLNDDLFAPRNGANDAEANGGLRSRLGRHLDKKDAAARSPGCVRSSLVGLPLSIRAPTRGPDLGETRRLCPCRLICPVTSSPRLDASCGR